MSENKKGEFRSERFTWRSGELEKEDKIPEDLTTKFHTYYEIESQLNKQKEERGNEPK